MKIIKKHIFKVRIVVCILFLSVLVSCSLTKNVPKDKQILTKVTINCEDKEISKSELSNVIRQSPNRKTLFLFRFHLGVYNLFYTEKPRKFRNKIANVVGEPPVIYENYETAKTTSNIQLFLQSQSYYDAKVDYSEDIDNKKQTAKVVYNVYPGKAYKISELNYDIPDSIINVFVSLDTINSLLKVGNKLNTDILQKERERITKMLKSNGYYYFTTNNIHYYADSTINPYEIQLTVSIRTAFETENQENIIVNQNFDSQIIRKIYIYPDFDSQKYLINKEEYLENLDTIIKDGYEIIYYNSLKIKPSTLLQSCYLSPGDWYNIRNVEKTHQHFSSLKIFKIINIVFSTTNDTTIADSLLIKYIDAYIYLTPLVKRGYSLEGEVYSTSGNWGLASYLTYNNRSLFKAAQQLFVKGLVSFQTLTSTVENTKSLFFNTIETGVDVKLKIPRMVIPFWDNYYFTKEHNPHTQFGTSFNYQKRPEYIRTIGNLSFGYVWKDGKRGYITHSLNPIELYTVKIYNFDEKFKQTINNSFLKFSYENQLLTVISYNFMYNNQNINKLSNFVIFWTNIETSGNIPYLIYKASKQPKIDGSYKIFEVEFSQFVKFDLDYIYYQIFTPKQQLVYRTYFGIGIPYGNSKGLPFIKKYFIGGANDLRAWAVRTLGPGAYSDAESRIEQIGDMKFVLNLEYRFNIITFSSSSQLNGALFLDSGNIWSLNKEDNREKAKFNFNSFYKQMALGTGFGLRYDMSFFIIRVDIGIPLYHPADSWIIKNLKFKSLGVNLGINYPF